MPAADAPLIRCGPARATSRKQRRFSPRRLDGPRLAGPIGARTPTIDRVVQLPITGSGGRLLLSAACLIVVLAGLKAAEPLLVPLVFSAFLGVLSAPAVLWLAKKRVPEGIAVALVVVAVVVALTLTAGFIGGSIGRFTAELPRYEQRFEDLGSLAADLLRSQGVEVSRERIRGLVDAGAVMKLVGATLASMASLLSNTMLVILTVVFILFEALAIPKKLRRALGDPKADLGKYTAVTTSINQYLVIKTQLSLATGALVALCCWVLGVDFALLWGLVAFLLNFVPNIGSVIAAVPPVLLAILQHGLVRAGMVAAAVIAINMVIGNGIEPKMMGRKLGLSSLVVFLSLVVWGWLWGPTGMLLSVPLTMIVKILLEHSGEWAWLAVMMGGEDEEAPPPSSLRPGPAAPSG